MAWTPQTRRSSQSSQRGYALLALLLILALMAIMAAVVVPTIQFQIERDREEELVHRGVQYSRAIRAYYKKFGRYPTKIEDLESTSNMRFLRKRYKDPINGQDFKLLHFGEVKMYGQLGGAVPVPVNGATPANGSSPFGNSTAFGSQTQPNAGPTGANNSSNAGNTAGGTKADSSDNPDPSADQNGSNADQQGSNGQPSGPTFGGGPIVGVASTSKKEGYREFNHKKKYNEWQFVYDPATGAGLLMGPNQPPPLQGFGQQPEQGGNQQNNAAYGFQGGAPGAPSSAPPPAQNNPGTPPATPPDTPSDPNQQ